MVEKEAGAVIIRTDEGAPRVLLVTAKNDPAHWLFPKGHIEPGETAEQAAVREAWEEAGVKAHVRQHVGRTRYGYQGRDIEVEYFLCAFVRDEDAAERRKLAWLPLDDARRRLSFDNTREMLDRARPLIASSPA